MIIDFTISNFLSIHEQQTFSFYAESSSEHLIENVAKPTNANIGVLRTASVYGPNASGKSNLLKAFKALQYIICQSGNLKEGDTIPCYEPYLLSDISKTAPTLFEIEFIAKDTLRYIYKVAFNGQQILTESLDYYPSRAPANLFKRSEADTWETISFGAKYKGGKKRHAFFANNSYLAKAGNSADAPKVVRDIYTFFRRDIYMMRAGSRSGLLYWHRDDKLKDDVSRILSSIDTGIKGFSLREKEVDSMRFPEDFPDKVKQLILEDASKEPVFLHHGANGYQTEFTEKMESEGTLKLFYALPLLIKVLEKGSIILIDELDTHYHPHIAELIINLFNDPSVNINNAQLIFTTHNINLMSPKLMRRDQIWLTQKNQGATTLTSLDEYDKSVVKINSPFHTWYDEGRFGAIPKINIQEVAEIIKKRMP